MANKMNLLVYKAPFLQSRYTTTNGYWLTKKDGFAEFYLSVNKAGHPRFVIRNIDTNFKSRFANLPFRFIIEAYKILQEIPYLKIRETNALEINNDNIDFMLKFWKEESRIRKNYGESKANAMILKLKEEIFRNVDKYAPTTHQTIYENAPDYKYSPQKAKALEKKKSIYKTKNNKKIASKKRKVSK